MTRLRTPHHRLRLQLVHLHRRRPGRHQPPAHGEQRASHPPALHGAHRPALHHQGLRARRRRRHRQRLPPGRLPLHVGQLPRPPALRRVPRLHGVHGHRPAPHDLQLGVRQRGRQVEGRGERDRRQRARPRPLRRVPRPGARRRRDLACRGRRRPRSQPRAAEGRPDERSHHGPRRRSTPAWPTCGASPASCSRPATCASSSAGRTAAAARDRCSSPTRPRPTSSSSTRAACTTWSRT